MAIDVLEFDADFSDGFQDLVVLSDNEIAQEENPFAD